MTVPTSDQPVPEFLDSAYLYALDLLPVSEELDIERRRTTADPAVARAFDARVRDARETMAYASSSTAQSPPNQLRDRTIRALPASNVIDLSGRRRRLQRIVAAAAAVVVLAVGGAVVATNLGSDGSGTPSAPTGTVVLADDTRTVTSTVDGGGIATVSYSRNAGTATITLADLPDPPAGDIYQLWLLDGVPRSIGFAGGTMSTPTTVSTLGSATTVAVTVEPAGGSPSPTTDPIARVDLHI